MKCSLLNLLVLLVQDDEYLFQLDLDNSFWYEELDWWLEDADNGQELFGCNRQYNACHTNYATAEEQHCLPKDECYRFVIGDPRQGCTGPAVPSYSIRLDGRPIHESVAFDYEAFEFGNCTAEESHCNGPEEGLFEVFMYNDHQPQYNNTIRINTPTSQQLVEESIVHYSTNITTWYDNRTATQREDNYFKYFRTCLPVDECMIFTSDYPFEQEDLTERDLNEFRLSFNNVDYGVNHRYDSYFTSQASDMIAYNETPFSVLFGNCKVEQVCQEDSEALLAVQLNGSAELFVRYVDPDLQDPDRGGNLAYFNDMVSCQPGWAFQAYACIPTDHCTQFGIYPVAYNDNIVTYEVSVNGKIKHTGTGLLFSTLAGPDCEDDLSAGAIAGIVIGGTVVLAAAIFCGYRSIIWKKRSSVDGDDAEDTTPGKFNENFENKPATENSYTTF